MSSDTQGVETLLAQLDAQRDAYIEAFQRAHRAFTNSIAKNDTANTSASPARGGIGNNAGTRGRALSLEVPTLPESPSLSRPGNESPLPQHVGLSRSPSHLARREQNYRGGAESNFDASTLTDDSETDDDDDGFYVKSYLPTQSFDHEHLREHLKTYSFDEFGRQILAGIISDRGRLKDPNLFPASEAHAEEKRNYSHYQVFDVGLDGVPHSIATSSDLDQDVLKARLIWHAIKDINAGARDDQAVGRITVAREPSAILFGAMHLTYNSVFDMDEIYGRLVGSGTSSVSLYRSFEDNERRRRSFIFNFEYYTIIGEGRQPLDWQLADEDQQATDSHLPISRCSSVVALSLYGEPVKKIRNSARRARKREGGIYDPWQAWQVLNIQCYPDWKAKTDVHEEGKRYTNGPEAFLHTLLAEFKDAQRRFEEINKAISKLITPPVDFIFKEDQRDARLFEDKTFTFTRRYFWAHQVLGTMNDSINAIVEAYEDNFSDELWEGRHRTLWPLSEADRTGRNEHFRKRLKALKMAFTREINGLRTLIKENNDRRSEIRFLRDQLFSGTSVMESRKSVELSETTIQQGHNVKLLTLVNIFFLPLSFVTSVFGMQSMPEEHSYWMFAITITAVCVPFFLLIGSLNTTRGMHWWGSHFRWLSGRCSAFWQRRSRRQLDPGEPKKIPDLLRSMSAEQGMEYRLGRRRTTRSFDGKRDIVVEVEQPKRARQQPPQAEPATTAQDSSVEMVAAKPHGPADITPPGNVAFG